MGDQGRANDVVLKVNMKRFNLVLWLAAHGLDQIIHIIAQELAGLGCHARRKVGKPDDRNTVDNRNLAGAGQLTIPALLCRHVNNHAAASHGLYHRSGD